MICQPKRFARLGRHVTWSRDHRLCPPRLRARPAFTLALRSSVQAIPHLLGGRPRAPSPKEPAPLPIEKTRRDPWIPAGRLKQELPDSKPSHTRNEAFRQPPRLNPLVATRSPPILSDRLALSMGVCQVPSPVSGLVEVESARHRCLAGRPTVPRARQTTSQRPSRCGSRPHLSCLPLVRGRSIPGRLRPRASGRRASGSIAPRFPWEGRLRDPRLLHLPGQRRARRLAGRVSRRTNA